MSEDDKEILRRVILARLMDERLPTEDLRAAKAIVERCPCGVPSVLPQPSSSPAPRRLRLHRASPAASRGSIWRPVARAAGSIAIIVSVVYLAMLNEQMLGDLQERTVAAHALAVKCVVSAAGQANYGAIVRAETRILARDANACPRSAAQGGV